MLKIHSLYFIIKINDLHIVVVHLLQPVSVSKMAITIGPYYQLQATDFFDCKCAKCGISRSHLENGTSSMRWSWPTWVSNKATFLASAAEEFCFHGTICTLCYCTCDFHTTLFIWFYDLIVFWNSFELELARCEKRLHCQYILHLSRNGHSVPHNSSCKIIIPEQILKSNDLYIWCVSSDNVHLIHKDIKEEIEAWKL